MTSTTISKLPWVALDQPLNLTCVSPDIATQEQLDEFVNILAQNPGQRVAWSIHQSRGAARQRIHTLRQSAKFRDKVGVKFESKTETPNDPESNVYILVSWDPNLAGEQMRPTVVETRWASRHQLEPQKVAQTARELWGHSLDTERDKQAGLTASPQRKGAVTRRLMQQLADHINS